MTGRSFPRVASLAPLALLLGSLTLACSERPLSAGDDVGDMDNPFDPGTQYAGCELGEDCDSGWCLSPQGEPGFCTHPCAPGTNTCEANPESSATPACLFVGADAACALDCGDGRTCPPGMRCEMIDAGDEEPRSICF